MVRLCKSKYNGIDTDIYTYDNEVVSDYINNTGNFYELQFLDYIARNYNEQTEILDIGANIGNHSLFFAKFLNCDKVHSFEPFPDNLELLRKNMNDLTYKSIIYDIALSNKEGVMTLYNSQEGNNGGFSLHKYNNGTSYVVNNAINVITLDSLHLKNISMIKIDVENHENEVLEGAKQTILDNKPMIFIENLFHGFPNVCPDPEPHKKIFDELNYKKVESNIVGSFMDLWVSN